MAEQARAHLGPIAAAVFVTFFVSWGIVGWGFGWMSPGTAESRANTRVEAALKPVVENYLSTECLKMAQADPEMATKLTAIKEASPYQKASLLLKTGWASISGFNLSKGNTDLLVKLCLPLVDPPVEANAASTG